MASSNSSTLQTPQTFNECRELVESKAKRWGGKLGNNTYLVPIESERLGDPGVMVGSRKVAAYGIRYHNTIVVEMRVNGDYVYHTGGFDTMTTKDRISAFLPAGWCLGSDKGDWILFRPGNAQNSFRPRAEFVVNNDFGIDAAGNVFGFTAKGDRVLPPSPESVTVRVLERVALMRDGHIPAAVTLNYLQTGFLEYYLNGAAGVINGLGKRKGINRNSDAGRRLIERMEADGYSVRVTTARKLREQVEENSTGTALAAREVN